MARQSRPSLDLLKEKENLVGAEIGVLNGENAKWMLEHLDIEKLFLIDPYEEYRCNNNKPLDAGGIHPAMPKSKEKAKKILAPWEDKIEYIYKFSWDALDDFENKSLDFVYIDGDHRKEALLKDLEYISKIKLGGLICGHDWRFPSVQAAITEFASTHGILFECCHTAQFVKIIDKHAQGSDWWIELPDQNLLTKQQCKLCQNKYKFTIEDVEWLKL